LEYKQVTFHIGSKPLLQPYEYLGDLYDLPRYLYNATFAGILSIVLVAVVSIPFEVGKAIIGKSSGLHALYQISSDIISSLYNVVKPVITTLTWTTHKMRLIKEVKTTQIEAPNAPTPLEPIKPHDTGIDNPPNIRTLPPVLSSAPIEESQQLPHPQHEEPNIVHSYNIPGMQPTPQAMTTANEHIPPPVLTYETFAQRVKAFKQSFQSNKKISLRRDVFGVSQDPNAMAQIIENRRKFFQVPGVIEFLTRAELIHQNNVKLPNIDIQQDSQDVTLGKKYERIALLRMEKKISQTSRKRLWGVYIFP
jgi:hypothetical protein